MSLQEIAIFADTRHSFTGKEARQYASQFRLRLARGKAQGVACAAFSQGRLFQVLNDPEAADRNFTPRMKQFYARKGLRNWRSLIAFPLLETRDRLPVGVVALSSNLAKPFWSRFADISEQSGNSFKSAVTQAAQELLVPSTQIAKNGIE